MGGRGDMLAFQHSLERFSEQPFVGKLEMAQVFRV